jgi:hypothetical protein
VAVSDANPAFFVFVLYMIGDMLVCALCCVLLVRVAQHGGVARMFTTLPNADKMPILQHYAYASHSPELPIWYAVTFLQCAVGAICWLLASLIAVTTSDGDFLVVALLVAVKLIELLVRYQQFCSFYTVVVLGSVCTILSSESRRKRYAASRALGVRSRLSLVNPDSVTERPRKPRKERQSDAATRQKDV